MSGHVFISYTRKDRDYVEEFANVLAKEDIPVWFDRQISNGSVWTALLQEQIDTCAAFVLIMTPAARESEWVKRELAWAMREGKRIVPVLLDGRPFFEVVDLDYEDARTGAMPSARLLETLRGYIRTPNVPSSDEGKLLFEMRAHEGHVRSVAYPAKNASMVASAGPEMCVRVWDPTTGRLRLEIANATWPVAFSQDGTVVATGGPEFTVYLWDTATGQLIDRVGEHRRSLISIAISPDGRSVVTGSRDGSECIWDGRTGALVHTLAGRVDPGSPLVFSPDGRWLIAPTSSGGARSASIWDVATGRLLRTLGGHRGLVHDVTVSWDGKHVATGGDDRTARIWDAMTGTERHLLGVHTMPVRAVAFSPDGHRLATGSTDRSIRLWDAATGAHLKRITSGAGGIYDLAYSPDGKTLASGHGDGAIRIWSA